MSPGRRSEVLRLGVLVLASSALGLAANALSKEPVPLLSSTGPGAWPDRAVRITAEQLGRELASGEPLLLIDARGDEARRAGHPTRSVHAPATRFLDAYRGQGLASALKAATGAVVICESDECPSGDRVARLLRELGHPNVRVFEGGGEAYRRSGLDWTGP